jgi:hypothetical protein
MSSVDSDISRALASRSASTATSFIARGIFTSVKDLDRKIMRYIRSYNRKAHPIKWSYKDAPNRIKTASQSSDTLHWDIGQHHISAVLE